MKSALLLPARSLFNIFRPLPNLALLLVGLCVPGSLPAGGLVNPCTDAGLRAALAGGGVVTFDCDGVIVLTNTLTISANTQLDGTGRQVVLSGGGSVRPFVVQPGVQFTLRNVTVADGFGAGQAGGLLNSGHTRLFDCTFSNNLALGTPGTGGAIQHGSGTLEISGCAFLFNRALGTNGFTSVGGAIAGGFTAPAGPLLVTNSTFAGNSATSVGAIALTCAGGFNGNANLVHVTLAGNTNGAVSYCAGFPGANARLTLHHCVLGSNQGPNCFGVTDGGYNLSSDSSGGFTHPFSLENVDPRLGPLAANGGPTLTLAPLPDSPAIDAGPATGCAANDQRGNARPFGPACDLGAVEATFAGTHPGVIQFARPGETFPESNGVVTIPVVRAGGGAGNVSVDFATGNLVATAGLDFLATNGTLAFASGQRSNTFELRLLDDSLVEGNETLLLNLSAPGGGASLGRTASMVTLLDNDVGVAFATGAVGVSEREPMVPLTVVRTGNTSGVVTVNWTTAHGTAGNADYTPGSGVVQFLPGQVSSTFFVPLRNDELVEADETFSIHLSNPSAGATLGGLASVTVTIYDEDGVRVVNDCSEAALRFALGIGGRVHLDCDGTIVLADTIFVTQNATLDAVGRQVTLSGNQVIQPLRVVAGVRFGLREITIAHGFSAIQGGGLHNQGELEIRDCTFASNVVASATAPSGAGGAIHNLGTLRVSGSTFRDNRASFTGGAIASGYGFTPVAGTLFLTNCTFAGNVSSNGAALAAGGTNDSYLVHGTLSGNAGQAAAGRLTIVNSILAGSSGANCGPGLTDGGYNLSSDGSCGFTHPASRINIDPRLDAFGAHGGLTWTWSLLDASPATDAANAAASPATDQRGAPRPYGVGTDIGAFETTLIPPHPGVFNLATGTVSTAEGMVELLFTVTRTVGAHGTASVNFVTAGGTATAGTDYIATNGTLVFAPGEVQKSFVVRLLDDGAQEPDESFLVAIALPTGGALLGTHINSVVLILDDESPAVVTSCDDASLRAAIAARPVVRIACDGVIVLTNPIVIGASTWIDASDRTVTLSGSNAVRLFHVQPGASLSLLHLTLADGLATGTNGAVGQPGGPGIGGAVRNDGGILVANDCTFARNRAIGGQGGLGSGNPFPAVLPGGGGTGIGGAIHSTEGQNFLTNVVFEANRAVGGRGGDYATSQGGSSGPSRGGAIHATGGRLVLHQVTCLGNGAAFGSPGGGLRFGTTAAVAGGALDSTGAVVTVRRGLFQDNACGLGVDTPTFVRGGAASGGAIWIEGGSMDLTDTSFLNNAARGGPTYMISSASFPGGNALGGALWLAGPAAMTNCSLGGNVAQGGPYANGLGPASGSGLGGAVFNRAALQLHNVTVANNTARGGDPATVPGDGLGGGLFNEGGSVFLRHATLGSNSALRSPTTLAFGRSLGGGLFSTNGDVILVNSIVAHSLSGSNGFGVFVDQGHNLSSDGSLNFTAPGSVNHTDPKLGPLADYGGPTRTMALLAGSPALDAAASGDCPATDQRGIARPFGGACDIGAFESAPPYTILGQVTGFHSPASGIAISSPAGTTSVPPGGAFAIHGLPAGTHVLSIASPECVFVPVTRTVTLGPDVVDVTFHSYRSNALVMELVGAGQVRATYAGAAFQTSRVLVSSNLLHWVERSTHTTDSRGLFEFVEPTTEPRRFHRVVRP